MSAEIRRLQKIARGMSVDVFALYARRSVHEPFTVEAVADLLQCHLEALHSQASGAAFIAAERASQHAKWDAAHDASHQDGSLAVVAATLATDGTDARVEDLAGWRGHKNDPWGLPSKHRGDRIRQLVIAGALLAAEIDRLRRLPAGSAAPSTWYPCHCGAEHDTPTCPFEEQGA